MYGWHGLTQFETTKLEKSDLIIYLSAFMRPQSGPGDLGTGVRLLAHQVEGGEEPGVGQTRVGNKYSGLSRKRLIQCREFVLYNVTACEKG